MIRYSVSETELIAMIDAISPTWRDRAKRRTKKFITAGCYSDKTDIWGEIKTVYINLQHEKCGYCETKLQGTVLASKVHEVEHYRPKSSVREWPNPAVSYWKDFAPTWSTGTPSTEGYYRLAYHPLNYLISCTRCNSTLKSNYFPVRGNRDFTSMHPTTMLSESALLLYPIASTDPDNPEDIITFDGVLAVPRHLTGPSYERAVTNIEFFQLNHQDLTSRRGEEILDVWTALSLLDSLPSEKTLCETIINNKCGPKGQFSACLSAYVRLYRSDYAKAKKIKDLIIAATPHNV